MAAPDTQAAVQFLAATARILDWRRYQRLFEDGPAAALRDALAAYQNDDGGFGHGLEPDGRTPGSQPSAVMQALGILHEADVWDAEIVDRALTWLAATAPDQGGAMFVHPNVEGWPHAPWWQPADGLPPNLLITGRIAGTLHARGVGHPWLEQATTWMWSAFDDLGDVGPYEMHGVLNFLQQVPDRARADAAFDKVGARLLDPSRVALDPEEPGEVHAALDFARFPDSMARRVFDQSTIDAHLDHLARAQQDDGGWVFNWPSWSPAAERDWRGSITVDALVTLRANGRLPDNAG